MRIMISCWAAAMLLLGCGQKLPGPRAALPKCSLGGFGSASVGPVLSGVEAQVQLGRAAVCDEPASLATAGTLRVIDPVAMPCGSQVTDADDVDTNTAGVQVSMLITAPLAVERELSVNGDPPLTGIGPGDIIDVTLIAGDNSLVATARDEHTLCTGWNDPAARR